MTLERKRAAGLAVMLATPYVDDLSVFVRVAIDRPNAVARLFMLFEIEQGADSIPVCIVILGRYVLKDELAGRAVIKQMADVADDVAVFVNACGTKIARGAKANDEIVEADRRCGSVVCKCRPWPMPNAAVSGRLASGDNAASPRPNVNARRLMAWCSVITSPFVGFGYAIVLVTILLRCLKMLV